MVGAIMEKLISLTCQYGRSASVTEEEVEDALCSSVQTLVLPKEEWS
jgi:hypothetical protein